MLHPALRGVPGLIGGVLVGRGGSSRIYRATQEQLGRTVAVKILNDPQRPSRLVAFEAECLALGTLGDCPHIVKVLGAGATDRGDRYIVLDYHPRGSLYDRITHIGALPASEISTILVHLVRGLRVAHGSGIIHGDVKPGNVLIDERGRVLLVDFGVARLMASETASPAFSTPRFAAPEVAEHGAISAASDIYGLAATAVAAAGLKQSPVPERALRDRLGSSLSLTLAACLAPDPQDRPLIEELGELEGDDFLQQHVDEPFTVVADLTSTESWGHGRCPYKGLSSYDPQDGPWFYGRDRYIGRLVDLVDANPLVAVVGPSGSGKSSLVRAGLLPALSADGVLGRSVECELRSPSTDTAERLIDLRFDQEPELERIPYGITTLTQQGSIGTEVQVAAQGNGAIAQETIKVPWSRLLIIDQFEEVFTAMTAAAADALVADISHRAATGQQRVVIVVRDDFYGRCTAYPELAEAISRAQLLVGPIRGDELAELVRRPAQLCGLVVEDALVEELVDVAAGRPGALPLVSHALAETWANHNGKSLTLDGYRSAGGVEGAIGETAASVYAQLDSKEQQAARGLLLRMVSIGDGGYSRRRLSQSELAEMDPDGITVPIVAALVSRRILTSEDGHIEVAHECLFEAWPMLQNWLATERAYLQLREDLERGAQRWNSDGRAESDLWRGSRLEQALELLADDNRLVSPTERDFVAAGRDARDLNERTLRLNNTRIARSNRFLRGLALALVAATAMSLGAGVAFFSQRQTARRATDQAQAASETAQLESDRAVAASQRVSKAAREAVARTLVSDAESFARSNNDLALLLAAEASKRSEGGEALGALASALNGGSPVGALAFQSRHEVAAAGQVIAMADGWSLINPTGDPSDASFLWHPNEPRAEGDETPLGLPLTANESGTHAVLAQADGVVVWDRVGNKTKSIQLPAPVAASWGADDSVSFVGPDGSLLVANLGGSFFAEPTPSSTGDDAISTTRIDGIEISQPYAFKVARGRGWTAAVENNSVFVIGDDGTRNTLDGIDHIAGAPLYLATDSTGRRLAVASSGEVSVWEIDPTATQITRWEVAGLEEWDRDLGSIAFLDSDRLIGLSQLGDATAFNIVTQRPVANRRLDHVQRDPRSVRSFEQDLQVLVYPGDELAAVVEVSTASSTTAIDFWAAPYTGLPNEPLGGEGATTLVTPDRIFRGEIGQVTAIDRASGTETSFPRVAPRGADPFPYAILRFGKRLLGAGISESVWDPDIVISVAESRDRSSIAAYYIDGMIDVWDSDGTHRYSNSWGAYMVSGLEPDAANLVGDFATATSYPNLGELALSPDGRYLAISYVGLHVVDTVTGEVLFSSRDTLNIAAYGRVVITDRGQVVAATGSKLHRYDLTDRSHIALDWQDGFIRPLTLNADQSLVYVGNGESGRDALIQAYDVSTLGPAGPPIAVHDGTVTALALSPDGKTLYSAALDGSVRQTPLDGDKGSTIVTGEQYLPYGIQTDPDAIYLVTTEGRRVRISVDESAWIEAACSKAGRTLTQTEWKTYLSEELAYDPAC